MDHLRPDISSIHNFLLTFPTNFHLILTFALSRILQHACFVKTTMGIRFVKYMYNNMFVKYMYNKNICSIYVQ